MVTASQETVSEEQLAASVAKYFYDPFGYALFTWNWDAAPLNKYGGLDDWQIEFLVTLGEECKKRAGGVDTDAISAAIRMAAGSGHGVGKFLSNHELIYTEGGAKRIGDAVVGDFIYGQDGLLTKVTGVFPQGKRALYRVRFSDGSSVLAGGPHLWEVTTEADRDYTTADGKSRSRVVTTDEMRRHLHRRYQIPITEPVQFPERQFLIDPYFMGYAIGDGSLCTKGAVRISTSDHSVYDRIGGGLVDGYGLHGLSKSYLHVSTGNYTNNRNIYWHEFDRLGLSGKRSHEKFVPDEYKVASVAQRLALLQGLMDADGCVSRRKGRVGSRCVFATSSERVRDDVLWLVRSLGGVGGYSVDDRRGKAVTTRNGSGRCRHVGYQLTVNLPEPLNPFWVERKRLAYAAWLATGNKRRPIRTVRSIEYECEEGSTCISVDNERSLYLTSDFIVTHNTMLVAIIIHWFTATRPNPQVVVTANTKSQLEKKTWRELGKMNNLAINGHWFEHTATRFIMRSRPKTWFATAEPWSENNSEAFAGTHEEHVLIVFDEASAIADIIWQVAEGAMTTPGAIFLAFGNRTRNTGRFSDCWKRFRHRWITFKVDARKSRVADQRQIQEWIDDYGVDSDFVKVRALGDEPYLGANQLIPVNIVDRAIETKIDPTHIHRSIPRLMGGDCAAGGDSKSVIIRRQGPRMLPEINRWNESDVLKLGGYFGEQIKQWEPDIFFLDAHGVGLGVYNYLIQLGFDMVVPVYWGDRSLVQEPQVYFNPRIECWDRMKQWLRTADIPDDNDLKHDLIGPEYYRDLQFVMKLERKEEMARRGLPSPDTADALAMTFFHAVPVKTSAFDTEDLEPEHE